MCVCESRKTGYVMRMYFQWNEQLITDFSENNITSLYNEGYVFTRKEKGLMSQTRSVRIDLSKCELSSENKRILRKTESILMDMIPLPFPEYDWSIGKLAKDFYDTKFGPGTMSANKIKEMFTDPLQSNFNATFVYFSVPIQTNAEQPIPVPSEQVLGYCVTFENTQLIHYSYPFYNLQTSPKDMGMGMMVRAIEFAKKNGKKYIYLGSAQRPTDTYKLQFAGVEWFDGKEWNQDAVKLKEILNSL